MKRFLVFLMLLLSFNIMAELNDVPVEKGEYKGYRKLVGHEYQDRFDVYFKVTGGGQQIATVPTFKGINLKEKVTLEMPDGEKRSATKKEWFKLFRTLKFDSSWSRYFREKYDDFYSEWLSTVPTSDVERMVINYIATQYKGEIETSTSSNNNEVPSTYVEPVSAELAEREALKRYQTPIEDTPQEKKEEKGFLQNAFEAVFGL